MYIHKYTFCCTAESNTILLSSYQFSSVQLLSRVQLFVTPVDCSTPGFLVLHCLLELAQIHFH